MESLQIGKILGEVYIGCGFIRGKLAGIYYDILGGFVIAWRRGGAF